LDWTVNSTLTKIKIVISSVFQNIKKYQ